MTLLVDIRYVQLGTAFGDQESRRVPSQDPHRTPIKPTRTSELHASNQSCSPELFFLTD